ncbi:MAG: gluconokinase [Chitinophagaceae bacterium]|nr:gluconokinase [Chitinophagaceae bacterium]
MSAPVIYIMGVSGSGKSTVGKKLSAATGIPFFDGDDFHSQANKEKMKAGHALNDEDRKDWLLCLNQLAKGEILKKGAIIACSALKERYRDLLSEGIDKDAHWIFLQGDYHLISDRMKERRDHYMPVSLLQSQFETLEAPANAIIIDISQTPEEIAQAIIKKLSL